MPKRYLRKVCSGENHDDQKNLDTPVFGLVATLIALLAVPFSSALESDLLVTPLSTASGIRKIVLLDLCDNPANGKVFRIIVHAQLLVFDLLDCFELIAAETYTCAAITST